MQNIRKWFKNLHSSMDRFEGPARSISLQAISNLHSSMDRFEEFVH